MFIVLIFCLLLCINFRGIEQQKEKKKHAAELDPLEEMVLALCYG